jgi:hypothetical protein
MYQYVDQLKMKLEFFWKRSLLVLKRTRIAVNDANLRARLDKSEWVSYDSAVHPNPFFPLEIEHFGTSCSATKTVRIELNVNI